MKIGIITDIHSNIQALKAVLNEFDRIKIDKIICCGDIIGIGINPEESVQELFKRKDMLISVQGNHEQYLLNGLPKNVHDNKREMNIEIEGKKILIVHYPQKNNGTYKKYIKNPTVLESKEMFKEYDADIFLFGHTHKYSINEIDNKLYINTGSLGCPLNSNISKAGLLEIDNGKIKFKSINVEYNVEEIIEEIYRLKFPFYKEILKIFYGIT